MTPGAILLLLATLVLVPLLVNEIGALAPWAAEGILRQAARLLPADVRDERLRQWLGDLDDAPGQLSKVVWAAGVALGARKLAREIRNGRQPVPGRRRFLRQADRLGYVVELVSRDLPELYVSRLSEMIGREWGMQGTRVQAIRIAGMVYDVERLDRQKWDLRKPGRLSCEEFEIIKMIPIRLYEMLSSFKDIDFLAEVPEGLYHRSERMDGRGFPMGLFGEEIPEFARILAVAAAFHSMTSLNHRLPTPVDEALRRLRRADQFDQRVVDCLVRAICKIGWEPPPGHYELARNSASDSSSRPSFGPLPGVERLACEITAELRQNSSRWLRSRP